MDTYYLEMHSKSDFIPKASPGDIEVIEAEIKNYRLNKYLYQLIGEPWGWGDKLSLPNTEWKSYAESSNLRTWVAYIQGSIAGYYELQSQTEGDVELKYFGLAPDFIGKGYGGYLLSHAIQSAWTIDNIRRLWVHTCSLDHPGALGNYQSRGFKIYSTVRS